MIGFGIVLIGKILVGIIVMGVIVVGIIAGGHEQDLSGQITNFFSNSKKSFGIGYIFLIFEGVFLTANLIA